MNRCAAGAKGLIVFRAGGGAGGGLAVFVVLGYVTSVGIRGNAPF